MEHEAAARPAVAPASSLVPVLRCPARPESWGSVPPTTYRRGWFRRRDRTAVHRRRKLDCKQDSVSLQDCYSFNLDLCIVFQQALHFNQNHRRKMFAHAAAITLADSFQTLSIFVLIGNIDNQARNLFRFSARLSHDGDHIGERAIELLDDIRAHDSLLPIPGHLAGDEEQTPARFR